jgi:hypothetical protein
MVENHHSATVNISDRVSGVVSVANAVESSDRPPRHVARRGGEDLEKVVTVHLGGELRWRTATI